MEKNDWIEAIVIGGLRVSASVMSALALMGMVIQVIESYYRFDPNYLESFILSRFSKPLILFGGSILLWFLSPRIARIASK